MLSVLLLAWTNPQQPEKAEDQPLFGPTEIGVAAEVLGLSFEEQELELMLPDVSERLKEFERLRAVHLENDVAPALVFWPAPGGPPEPGAVEHLHPVDTWMLPSSADPEALAFLDIVDLGHAIHQHRISCLELARMYLGRLKRLDEKLHCVVTLTEERALAQARALDEELAQGKHRGPLHGIPWVAKDLLAVKGHATTWGTPPYEGQVIAHDAAVVEKLDTAGAVLIAKVSLGELAWGDVWSGGQTRNPWKLDQGSSGSSAGSSAAVAAGCAAFAIGSETLGSIVSPSDRCGCSSLRPTFGRVSRYGAMALCWSLDKLGPICRSAEDAALVFRAIAGPDPRDPASLGAGPAREVAPSINPRVDVRGWKVGVPAGAFQGEGERCKHVLEELRSVGVVLVDVELPRYPVDEMLLVLAAEAGAAFDEFSRSERDDAMVRQERQAWPNVFRHAQLIPAVDYIRANRLRTLLIRDWEAALAGVKAIVHPSFAGSILGATNLGGQPTLVAPCGFREDGTPFSISFTGRLFGDREVLALAMAWQGATEHHWQHPKL